MAIKISREKETGIVEKYMRIKEIYINFDNRTLRPTFEFYYDNRHDKGLYPLDTTRYRISDVNIAKGMELSGNLKEVCYKIFKEAVKKEKIKLDFELLDDIYEDNQEKNNSLELLDLID